MFRFSTFQLWSKKKNEDKNSRGYSYGQGATPIAWILQKWWVVTVFLPFRFNNGIVEREFNSIDSIYRNRVSILTLFHSDANIECIDA